ncbi:MAG: orotidine-5'-phosphate decarboxylase [Zetaproteobacteria bacterium CG06_land_8_20_14_3_00_59_53]|nr:MAG: orotidine 5'-phosphate decarboxylase [Zetaproteobacteria bacterium CG2_30_59_37]PIO89107.1 MAG: orotidine-5'-phosphate decarboxylase [Zetaproteobacteria bacterium CG23_combo_of_CG06-09_8_20_14_all_59_86]PIQ65770.1 MAG: orotidine-5'-phosphate decarboxylase [Zetaproteobacteria bacterium CG11_big_fil_rev_8_21_14_0_20_59_439]PIU70255.1 MAG: orotidine-5'-phosphate decarboxylase [Zetaproteobacteria bacterium CG06_land_8_20_14_3_00_59_53]PIU96590.1 MAG: orotidine-5'-phosphate decarboxylase [Ze
MLALDLPDRDKAEAMAKELAGDIGWFKIGLRLFVAAGPELVKSILQTHRVFLDLKFHDIPNTVAEAIGSAGQLGVQMTNIHAAGGHEMMRAAADAAKSFPRMQLIAVTVLTSDPMPPEQARVEAVRRAEAAREAGLHGVVCSVHEVEAIKAACGHDFLTVTPGIRWGGQSANDQQRIADPGYAISQGADYLVVGRPILQAPDRKAAAREAVELMQAAARGGA